SHTLTLTINPPTPVIQPPFTATGTVGSNFSYTINATNNPTSYNATGLPGGLAINTGTGKITGKPTIAGIYQVTLSATNAGGTGTATLVITVGPFIATGAVGVPFSYQIPATGTPTSYNATVLPSGLTVDTFTGVISGIAAALHVTHPTGLTTGNPTTAGIYRVTISATNVGGTGTATLIITIGPFTAAGTVNVPFSYQIPATGTPASYDATGLPGGLTVNTTTGVISGTTTAVGAFSVTISAIYGTGSSAI